MVFTDNSLNLSFFIYRNTMTITAQPTNLRGCNEVMYFENYDPLCRCYLTLLGPPTSWDKPWMFKTCLGHQELGVGRSSRKALSTFSLPVYSLFSLKFIKIYPYTQKNHVLYICIVLCVYEKLNTYWFLYHWALKRERYQVCEGTVCPTPVRCPLHPREMDEQLSCSVGSSFPYV